MDLAFALRMPSPVWINVAPEKSFQSIRSLSTQPSSQSHTRSIHFLTVMKIYMEKQKQALKDLRNLLRTYPGSINTMDS